MRGEWWSERKQYDSSSSLNPQVHVRVRGQLAACSGGHDLYHEFPGSEDRDFCCFSHTPTHTPHVSSLTPPTASEGDTITISGSGFGSDASQVLVLFGDTPCEVDSVSDLSVQCVLGSGAAGAKQLFLQVAGGEGGVAEVDATAEQLNYGIVIEAVEPAEGSQAGGTEITISGKGFWSDSGTGEWSPEDPTLAAAYHIALVAHDDGCSAGWENEVTVDWVECDIISSSHMTITCITPANPSPGVMDIHDIMVKVRCRDGSSETTQTLPAGFTFSPALTPAVMAISPEQGSVYGGDTVTITGSGFPDDVTGVVVEVREGGRVERERREGWREGGTEGGTEGGRKRGRGGGKEGGRGGEGEGRREREREGEGEGRREGEREQRTILVLKHYHKPPSFPPLSPFLLPSLPPSSSSLVALSALSPPPPPPPSPAPPPLTPGEKGR